MEMLIGYPRYIIDRNDPKLDQRYEGLRITGDDFFEDDVELQMFDFRRLLLKVNRLVQEDRYRMPSIILRLYLSSRHRRPNRTATQFLLPELIL